MENIFKTALIDFMDDYRHFEIIYSNLLLM